MPDYLENPFDLTAPELINVLDETPFWSAPFGIQLLEVIEYKKNLQVLDIGFGTGFPLTEIAMRLGKTAKVYGIDPWEEASDRVKKKIEQYLIGNIELINGCAEEIPLKSDSIDLIVSNNGLNNVKDLDKCLEECARIIQKTSTY